MFVLGNPKRCIPQFTHGRRLAVADDIPFPIIKTAEEAAMLREMFQELVDQYVNSIFFKLTKEARRG
jgi:hypothetical protein